MEEIDFALSRIEARLDKLVVDLDQRLTALEGGGPHRWCERPWPVRCRLMQSRDLRLPQRAPAITPPAASAETVPAPARPVPLSPAFWVLSRRISLSRSLVGREQCRAHVLLAARRRADGVCRSFGQDTCAAPGDARITYDYALSLMWAAGFRRCKRH